MMMNELNKKKYNVMAPAGSWESLHAAIKAGANSVYFGVAQLNMRARAAKPFQLKDLPEIAETCKKAGVESYLTLNTIVYDEELPLMRDILDAAKNAGVSAVIATDMSVIQYASEIGLEVHISTQANISNIGAVKFFSRFSPVMVLARELTLKQIHNIYKQIQDEKITGPNGALVRIELFVHGALCVSISGKCYMSLGLYNHSANRGDCLQTCRRTFKVTDEHSGDELVVDNKFVMSPKDLCTISIIDQLMMAGARVFKIEGRGRSADYVFHTTKCYREAVDAVLAGTFTQDKVNAWTERLENIFNRGFWYGGYYHGAPLGEWSGAYGSRAKMQKTYIGQVSNYFKKPKIAEFLLHNDCNLTCGDKIAVIGPTTGYAELTIESMYVNDKPAQSAHKGDTITLPFPELLRRNDKLYVIRPRTHWQS